MNKYDIKKLSGSEQTITIEAETLNAAKRKACKFWGFSPSDHWLGVSNFSGYIIKEDKH